MAASVRQRRENKKSSGKPESSQQPSASKPSQASTASKPAPASSPTLGSWAPMGFTAFKLLLSARLAAAMWSNISDCDETFNYWEPLHYLLHGTGLQTWEYSPQYALRSYAYLWMHAAPLKVLTALAAANKIVEFYYVRFLLAFFCSLCELYFYKAVKQKFGGSTALLFLIITVLSPGLFISSAALLPSSFAMYMTMLAMGAWYTDAMPLAILATAASAFVGWPFAGAIGIPIAYDLLFRRRLIKTFIVWSVISLVVCLVPLVLIDSYYYGKLVIAPLNIVLYNVFSEHGSELYGVEPWWFYGLNGFLNFNLAFPLALCALPILYLVNLLTTEPKPAPKVASKVACGLPTLLALAPLYVWLLVMVPQPHKEERFLFPIYPLICLAAALSLTHIEKLYSWLAGRRVSADGMSWVSALFCAVFALLSVSRCVALYKGYHAPLDVYAELETIAMDKALHPLPPDTDVNLCVGKEWYRFPSNFFLPSNSWHVQFIKSEFEGQLPQHYSDTRDSTRRVPQHMNDRNLEEESRYVDLSQCHYLVDLDTAEETPHEPRYVLNTREWRVAASASYLDNSRSPRLLRAFYIPFLSPAHCFFTNYTLLSSTHIKHRDL